MTQKISQSKLVMIFSDILFVNINHLKHADGLGCSNVGWAGLMNILTATVIRNEELLASWGHHGNEGDELLEVNL